METHLEVECLVIDGDCESCHILIIDADNGALQADTAPPYAFGHFLFGL